MNVSFFLSSRRAILAGASSLAILLATSLTATPAFAYSGYNAANYADQYALNYNTGKYSTQNADCTNFVSQALHAGGFSFVSAGQNASDDHNWWYQWGAFGQISDTQSNSWKLVVDNYNFLMLHNPGGWNYGKKSGTSNAANPDGLSAGDVLYYDWHNTGNLDHAAFQVVNQSYDPTSGWYGDLVDAHQTNHYHAIWTLEPYHASTEAATTKITLVHVDSANN